MAAYFSQSRRNIRSLECSAPQVQVRFQGSSSDLIQPQKTRTVAFNLFSGGLVSEA